MNLEALQKLAEQSLFDQCKMLLSQFQQDTNTIEEWDSEARVFFETMVQQILHAASLSMPQKKKVFETINNWGDPRLKSPIDQQYWVELSVAVFHCWWAHIW